MNIEYKLIKRYPGLRAGINIGDVVNKNQNGVWHVRNMYSTAWDDKYFKDYPEFWEVIKEPVEEDYGILSLIGTTPRNKNIILDDKHNILAWLDGNKIGWTINSIKRLSDGEIFTIGNKVKDGNITYIEKNEDAIWLYHSGKTTNVRLLDANKPKPIFTTEDKVDTFKGDIYWFTTKSVNKDSTINENLAYGRAFTDDFLRFSTKEKCQEYINSKRVKVEDDYIYSEDSFYSILDGENYRLVRFSFLELQRGCSGAYKHFKSIKARDEYIEDNKPLYSKKDMLDFATDVKNGYYGTFNNVTTLDRFNNWIKK